MIWLYLLAAAAGIANTVMAGPNTMLAKKLQQPLAAAVVVYAVGLIAALTTAVVAATFRTDLQWPAGAARSVPWWGWIGGALGSIYVVVGLTVPQQIGAASFIGFTVTAAVITSLIMDHFGLLGFKVHAAGVGRIIGAMLMLAGLVLVAKF